MREDGHDDDQYLRQPDNRGQVPELLHRTRWQRFGAPLVIIGTLFYVLYAVWFFNLPKLVGEARWDRFAINLLQWVSYDVQPQFACQG